MSKRTLRIEIDCGEKTCASKPGKFCPQVTVGKFGKYFSCHLFEKGLEGPPENPVEGWLQRLPECLAAEPCHGCEFNMHNEKNKFFCELGERSQRDTECKFFKEKS